MPSQDSYYLCVVVRHPFPEDNHRDACRGQRGALGCRRGIATVLQINAHVATDGRQEGISSFYRVLKRAVSPREVRSHLSAAQAVVTVPASFTLAQREAMQVATTWAGIRVRLQAVLAFLYGARCRKRRVR